MIGYGKVLGQEKKNKEFLIFGFTIKKIKNKKVKRMPM